MSKTNLGAGVRSALDAGEGILRLAPPGCRASFLMPAPG